MALRADGRACASGIPDGDADEPRAVSRRPGGQARRAGHPGRDAGGRRPLRGAARRASSACCSWGWAAPVTPPASPRCACGRRASTPTPSTPPPPRPSRAMPDTLVVPISATGSSRETLDAVARYTAVAPPPWRRSPTSADSALARAADLVIPMHAGVERGGVSLPHLPAHARPAARPGGPPHRVGPGRGGSGAAGRRGHGRPAGAQGRVAAAGAGAARRPARGLHDRPGGAPVVGRAVGADVPGGPAPRRRTPARRATGRTWTST